MVGGAAGGRGPSMVERRAVVGAVGVTAAIGGLAGCAVLACAAAGAGGVGTVGDGTAGEGTAGAGTAGDGTAGLVVGAPVRA